jgi:hypothetical protein
MGLGRNHRDDFPCAEGVDQRIGVISLVANQGVWIGVFEQRFGASQIVAA